MNNRILAIATLFAVTAVGAWAQNTPRRGQGAPGNGQQAGQQKGKKLGPKDGTGPIHQPGTGGGTGAGRRTGRR